MQKKIDQLLLFRRECIQKNEKFPEQSQHTLEETKAAVIENEKKIGQHNKQISELVQKNKQKRGEWEAVHIKIDEQEHNSHEYLDRLYDWMKLKETVIKLGLLALIFLVMFWLLMKYRTGTYRSMVWVALLVVSIQIVMIVYKDYPSRYYKYIWLVMLGVIIVWILLGQILKMNIENKRYSFKAVILTFASTYMGAIVATMLLSMQSEKGSNLRELVGGFLLSLLYFPVGLGCYFRRSDFLEFLGRNVLQSLGYLVYPFLFILALCFRGKKVFIIILIIWIALLVLNIHGCVNELKSSHF